MTTHVLPELGFASDALAPHISAETFEYHHGKHHNAYVTNLNKSDREHGVRERRVSRTSSRGQTAAIFNNAAQHFNHSFYWKSMSPDGPDGAERRALATAIDGAFGSFDSFKDEFGKAAMGQFGSGWAWLVKNGDGSDRDRDHRRTPTRPIRDGKTVLLTCDVWEHAYYIDYRNNRKAYVDAFWNIANWNARRGVLRRLSLRVPCTSPHAGGAGRKARRSFVGVGVGGRLAVRLQARTHQGGTAGSTVSGTNPPGRTAAAAAVLPGGFVPDTVPPAVTPWWVRA